MASSSGCLICEDPSTGSNPIIVCIDCGIKVHKLCYGIEKPFQWKCSPCQKGKSSLAACKLCMKKGGALKKTTCGHFVHVICALFTSGVSFPNKKKVEPVDLTKISSSKRNKLCSYCFKSQGYAGFCATKECKNRLHITCAQQKGKLKEVINPKDDSIQFNAYCKKHEPKRTSQRLSSESVDNMLHKKDAEKETASIVVNNSDWIFDQLCSTPKNDVGSKRKSGT